MSDADAAPQAGSAEAADLAARNLERALMASGHERPEGDWCSICFLLIELPVGRHSSMNADPRAIRLGGSRSSTSHPLAFRDR